MCLHGVDSFDIVRKMYFHYLKTSTMEATNIYDTLLPMFVCSKMFGLCSFSLNRKKYSKGLIALIFPITVTILFTTHTVSELYTRKNEDDLLIYILTDRGHTYTGVFCTISILLLSILLRNKMILVLKLIHHFDLQMRRNYPKINYKGTMSSIKIGSILSCALLITLTIAHYATDTLSFPPQNVTFYNFNGIITYCTPFVMCNIMVLQFSTLLIVLKQRFGWINEELMQLKQYWNGNSNLLSLVNIEGVAKRLNNEITKWDVMLAMEDLRKRHSTIHTLTQNVNNIFSLQSLLTITHNFLDIIVYLMVIVRTSEQPTISYRIFTILVILSCSGQLIVMCYVGFEIKREAKQAALIIHNFKNVTQEVEIYIRNFSLQILHSDVNITACHMFSIDKHLLFTVLSGITSYLVLLIQLEISSYT